MDEGINNKDLSEATFGAGCFWGVEEAFRKIPGVVKTEVGFMGGSAENPSYDQVCKGDTGHAEVVHVYFDPKKVSYRDLLEKFWEIHDPTTKNRQGPDVGSQYRSVIFYYSPEQKVAVEKSKQNKQDAGRYSEPIVTEIKEAGAFYQAEDYHQQYFAKQGGGSCHV